MATQATLGIDISLSDMAPVAYSVQGREKGQLQYFYCKRYDHIARACPQKFAITARNQGISSRSVLHDLQIEKL